MDARDHTPRNGESVSGESYPQYCPGCRAEWQVFGRLDTEDQTCRRCGLVMSTAWFYKSWAEEFLAGTPTVEIQVPKEVSEAVDALNDVWDMRREDLLVDLLQPQFQWSEGRDRR